MDFEKAAIGAFRTKFPTAQLQGCYFHMNQAMQRHLQGAEVNNLISSVLKCYSSLDNFIQ